MVKPMAQAMTLIAVPLYMRQCRVIYRLALLLVWVMAGSAIGPAVSKFIPENGLRGFPGVVLVLIGLRYSGLVYPHGANVTCLSGFEIQLVLLANPCPGSGGLVP